jgi:hypothetical protein
MSNPNEDLDRELLEIVSMLMRHLRHALEVQGTQKDWRERLVAEKADLDAKHERLGKFKNTEAFARLPWQEQERLNTQGHLMCAYSAVLGERIAAAKETP